MYKTVLLTDQEICLLKYVINSHFATISDTLSCNMSTNNLYNLTIILNRLREKCPQELDNKNTNWS